MNKENSFLENQLSTGISDSYTKSTYSTRFVKTQKRLELKQSILPIKMQKAAKYIQRFWRFRQFMKRRINQIIIQSCQQQNGYYQLQNNHLQVMIKYYQKQNELKQSITKHKKIQYFFQLQSEISTIKKQCVMASFKWSKKEQAKQILQQLFNRKQQEKQLNLLIDRQKLIIQQQLNEQKRLHHQYLRQIRQLNAVHLAMVQQKNLLSHKSTQYFLQTCKFGSKQKQKDLFRFIDQSNKQNFIAQQNFNI